MDIIKLARELAKEIQKDDRFKNLISARENNDNDKELQDGIGEFNLVRIELTREAGKTEKDEEKIKSLDKKMNEIYKDIMMNENMQRYNEAKLEMDALMKQITTILTMSANGEDPDSIDVSASCSGNCSSCGGCH
jgi:cell fate (sporulation/competence/biofilm development) regulator YlbF (YheA/YmcA/DUF963 family)